jgi:hypothetical protein
MNVTELATWLGLVVALLTGIGFPLYLVRKKDRAKAAEEGLVSWIEITKVLQKERDQLQARVQTVEKECEDKIRIAESVWQRKLDDANSRIRYLENEVDELYRRLYNRPKEP